MENDLLKKFKYLIQVFKQDSNFNNLLKNNYKTHKNISSGALRDILYKAQNNERQ